MARRRSARQRAALRKAQLASARKRRGHGKTGRFLKSAGVVAGGIALSAAYYHANVYARDPGKAVRHGKAVHSFVTKKKSSPPKMRIRKPSKIGYYPSSKAARSALRRR